MYGIVPFFPDIDVDSRHCKENRELDEHYSNMRSGFTCLFWIWGEPQKYPYCVDQCKPSNSSACAQCQQRPHDGAPKSESQWMLLNVVFISSEISFRYQYLQLPGIISIPATNHWSFSSLPSNLEVNSLKNKQLHSHVSTLEIIPLSPVSWWAR